MAVKKHEALSPDEIRDELREFVKSHGSLAAAADQLSTTGSHLSEILSGQRSVGDAIAAQLGFQLVKQKKVITVSYYIGSKTK